MLIQVCKSKIHRVTIKEASLDYVGSITIDKDLMDAADLVEYEKVLIVDHNNGERFETYVIEGKNGSGIICINGPSARKVQVGDKVIIISFGIMEQSEAKGFKPTMIFPDEQTNLIKK